jgi:RNA methyltransferase, TrmH family
MTGEPDAACPERGVEATLVQIENLQSSRRSRDASGLFFIEGVRNLVAAVDAGFSVQRLLVSDVLLTSAPARSIVRELRRAGTPDTRASPEEFRRISRADRASGVGAIVRQAVQPIHRVEPRAGTCWVVLSQVRSPGNFGSLIRTSAAIGGAGFVLIGGAVDPYEPVVVRATMGALFRQRFVRTGARQLRDWIRRHRLQVIGVTPDGSADYDRFRYRTPPILMLGEERQGLDGEQRALCETLVRIPMVPGTDSLNLAVAGGLVMYETFRCRSRKVTGASQR